MKYRKKAKYVLENKDNLQMRYDVSLKHLEGLSMSDLFDWQCHQLKTFNLKSIL